VAAARAAGGTKGRAAKPLYRLGTALRAVGAHAAAVAMRLWDVTDHFINTWEEGRR
jgi:hypothetical protein